MSQDGLLHPEPKPSRRRGDHAQVRSPDVASLKAVWLPILLFALSAGLVLNACLGPLGFEVIRYHFSASMRNQLIGLDAVALYVVAPLTFVCGVLAARRHPSASILAIAPGLFVAYLLPQNIVGPDYLGLPGNNQRFFLLHLCLFVLGVAVAAVGWITVDEDRMPDVPPQMARLASRVLFGAVVFLALGLHLQGVIDALHPVPADSTYRDGPTAFYLVKLMDLGLVVPACLVVGVGLSRRRPWAEKPMYPLIEWLALDAVAVSAVAIVMRLNNDPAGSLVLAIGFCALTVILVLLTIQLWRALAHPSKGYQSLARQ